MIKFILKENSGEKLKLGKINMVKILLISCKKVEKNYVKNWRQSKLRPCNRAIFVRMAYL